MNKQSLLKLHSSFLLHVLKETHYTYIHSGYIGLSDFFKSFFKVIFEYSNMLKEQNRPLEDFFHIGKWVSLCMLEIHAEIRIGLHIKYALFLSHFN